MGCDIHFKGYLYDRNSDDYIDIDIINKMGLEKPFPKLVGDRYYDLFGLFGNNVRSVFPMMTGLNDGCPDWFEKKDPYDFNDPDWYGFTHSSLTDMVKMLKDYQKKMIEGNIFLLNNEDEDAESLKRVYYSSLNRDKSRVEYLSISIGDILNDINDYYKISKDPKFNILCDLNGYSFDIDKTVFIFWFDN